MAALVTSIEPANASSPQQMPCLPDELDSGDMLDILQACLHPSPSEWIFLRELRVGTGYHRNSAQRLDAFAQLLGAHVDETSLLRDQEIPSGFSLRDEATAEASDRLALFERVLFRYAERTTGCFRGTG
jgi:hypothetical protein